MFDRPFDSRTDVRLQTFEIKYDYPVVFTESAFDAGNRAFVEALARRERDKRHRCLSFIDDGLLKACPDLPSRINAYSAAHAAAIDIIGVLPIPGGERCKNDPSTLSLLLDALQGERMDRHSFVIAIGGGAVLDAVGYASSIFHRGVRHIRFPTTVLAQADSGVGVKNAVNWNGVKNLIGAFAPPWAIINDRAFINILPEPEKRAGMAEAIKVALIRDRDFFEWIERSARSLAEFSPSHLHELIERSAELHMRQIRFGGDPFETGSARPLDFGHWSAHKLEKLTKHAVSHGEAVAIGLAIDARYSTLAGLLQHGQDLRILSLLRRLGFSLWRDELRHQDAQGRWCLLQGLVEFQEHLGGELSVTLLADLGRSVEANDMNPDLIRASVDWLEQQV